MVVLVVSQLWKLLILIGIRLELVFLCLQELGRHDGLNIVSTECDLDENNKYINLYISYANYNEVLKIKEYNNKELEEWRAFEKRDYDCWGRLPWMRNWQ